MRTPDISSLFDEIKKTFQQRRKAYGDSYLMFGEVMAKLFPNGLRIKGVIQFMALGILVHVVTKLTRFVHGFPKKKHSDSLRDIAVYCLMMDGAVEDDAPEDNSIGWTDLGPLPGRSKEPPPDDPPKRVDAI